MDIEIEALNAILAELRRRRDVRRGCRERARCMCCVFPLLLIPFMPEAAYDYSFWDDAGNSGNAVIEAYDCTKKPKCRFMNFTMLRFSIYVL